MLFYQVTQSPAAELQNREAAAGHDDLVVVHVSVEHFRVQTSNLLYEIVFCYQVDLVRAPAVLAEANPDLAVEAVQIALEVDQV